MIAKFDRFNRKLYLGIQFVVQKIRAIGSLFKTDIMVATLIATIIGMLGLLPHLTFAHEIGEFQYFHGAYDEDSYILSWFLGTLRITRALSGFALSVVYGICSSSLDATLIASDFVFPFLVTCAAYFAASQLISRRATRILVTLLLVFANDLFSLGNLSVWTSERINIYGFSKVVGRVGSNLVPSYETNFLTIFRTPEPQVSLALMFVVLGLLAKLAADPHRVSRLASVTLIVATTLLPLAYTFISVPTAAIAMGLMVVFAFLRLWTAANVIAIGLLGTVCVSLFAYYSQQSGAQSNLAAVVSYYSRAPVVTPATIESVILGIPFCFWTVRAGRQQPLSYLALGCLLLPALLSNQQIVSGVMISARDWERNASYPILVFGAAAALSLTLAEAKVSPSWSKVTWALSAICMLVALRAQLIAFRLWKPFNIESIAIVRALKAADPHIIAKSNLTFEDVSISQFIQVRMHNRINVPLSFYKVATNFIPNMLPDMAQAAPSPYEQLVFEHWLRTGMGPEKVELLLRSEIQQRAGTYTNYLFSFRDAWYPASDNRAVRQAELERSVGPIIARYERYLKLANHLDLFDQPALLISAKPPTELTSTQWIRNEYIGRGAAGAKTVYLYRQTLP